LISVGAAPQNPLGGVYSAPPDPLAGFKGSTSKGRERRKNGMEGQGKGEGMRGNLVVRRGDWREERGGEGSPQT